MGIYRPKTNLPIGSCKGQFCPSGRPPGRPANDQISDRCATGRPPGRPGLEPESNGSLAGRPPGRPELDTEQNSLPVNQGHFQRAELSGRSTARSTGPPAQAACPVRSTGRQPGPTLIGIKNLGF